MVRGQSNFERGGPSDKHISLDMTLSASEKGPERVFRYEETFLVLDLTTMLLLLNIFLPCQVPERLEANKQALSSLWRDANQEGA